MNKTLFFILLVAQTALIQAQEFTAQGGCNRTFTNLLQGNFDSSVDNFPMDFFNQPFAIGIVNYTNPTGGNIILDYQTFSVPVAEQNSLIFLVYDGLNATGNLIFAYNPSNSPSPGDQLTINSSTVSIAYVPDNPTSLTTEERQIRFNVTCEAPITCASPQNLEIQNLTTSSFDASWNSVGNATEGYEYMLMNANQEPDASIAVAQGTTSTTQQSFSGLTPVTDYILYVRANCGNTDGFSTWAGKSFNVPNQVLNLPINSNTWTKVTKNVPLSGATSQNIATFSLNEWNLEITDNFFTGNEAIAISPAIQIPANSSAEIPIDLINLTAVLNTELEIRVSTQTRNLEDFTTLIHSQVSPFNLLLNPVPNQSQNIDVPSINSAQFAGETIYIAIKLKKVNNNTQQHFIGIRPLVSLCSSFLISNNSTNINNKLRLNSRTANSASIGWQVPSVNTTSLITYQYVLMPRGEALDVDKAIAVGITNNTSFQFTGLEENTLYDAYVRTTCDGGQQFFGSTTERLTFSTLPETLVTCNETLQSPIYNSIANYISRDELHTFTAAEEGKMLKVEFL